MHEFNCPKAVSLTEESKRRIVCTCKASALSAKPTGEPRYCPGKSMGHNCDPNWDCLDCGLPMMKSEKGGKDAK